METLLPKKFCQELGRDISCSDIENAIGRLQKLIKEGKQIDELEDLQFAEIEEETNRLPAI